MYYSRLWSLQHHSAGVNHIDGPLVREYMSTYPTAFHPTYVAAQSIRHNACLAPSGLLPCEYTAIPMGPIPL